MLSRGKGIFERQNEMENQSNQNALFVWECNVPGQFFQRVGKKVIVTKQMSLIISSRNI